MQWKTSRAWLCSHSKGYQLRRGALSLDFCSFSLWYKIQKSEIRAWEQVSEFLDKYFNALCHKIKLNHHSTDESFIYHLCFFLQCGTASARPSLTLLGRLWGMRYVLKLTCWWFAMHLQFWDTFLCPWSAYFFPAVKKKCPSHLDGGPGLENK